MSPRATVSVLWLTLVATLPVPYFMVDIGWMPAAWLASVAAIVSASTLIDGFSGSWLIALLFIAQASVYIGLAYLVARLSSCAIQRLETPRARTLLALTLSAALWLNGLRPVYRNTLLDVDPRMSLLGLF